MNSSTSKNKTSKQENSTWTKTRLNETKTKLKREDRLVLKITFKILYNKPFTHNIGLNKTSTKRQS